MYLPNDNLKRQYRYNTQISLQTETPIPLINQLPELALSATTLKRQQLIWTHSLASHHLTTYLVSSRMKLFTMAPPNL